MVGVFALLNWSLGTFGLLVQGHAKKAIPRRSMAPRKHQAHPGAVPFPHHESQVNQGEWIHSPSDVGTEPIHFHQECTA